jgi:hypothetical protein
MDSLDSRDYPSNPTVEETRAIAVTDDIGRTAKFRRRAKALGILWIVFGSISFFSAGVNLWFCLTKLTPEHFQIPTLVLVTAQSLGLVVAGICTCRRSIWAIFAGLGITLILLIVGLFMLDISLSRFPRP